MELTCTPGELWYIHRQVTRTRMGWRDLHTRRLLSRLPPPSLATGRVLYCCQCYQFTLLTAEQYFHMWMYTFCLVFIHWLMDAWIASSLGPLRIKLLEPLLCGTATYPPAEHLGEEWLDCVARGRFKFVRNCQIAVQVIAPFYLLLLLFLFYYKFSCWHCCRRSPSPIFWSPFTPACPVWPSPHCCPCPWGVRVCS